MKVRGKYGKYEKEGEREKERVWRATAYRKDEDKEINLEKGFDLF